MTFSLVGRCPRTGQLGAGVATADIAVGARVPYAEAGVGAVLTQHRTDPRLGPRALALLRLGCDAPAAVAAVRASSPDSGWRQVGAIDASGATAAFSGQTVAEPYAELHGRDCLVLGNVLAGAAVGDAMRSRFEERPEDDLAERLLAALEAGLAAGGERSPLRSAALLVVADQPFPLVDLRVDEADEPLAALRRLWGSYRARVQEFVDRALAPDEVPV